VILTNPLKDRDQINRFARSCAALGHRAAGDEEGRDVQPRRRHQHARHDLVTVGDADQGVEPVRLSHGLDAVGDQLARGEAVVHAGMPHGDTVVDADGIELKRDAAGRAHRRFHLAAELLEVDMARNQVDIGVADADEGFFHVRIGQAGGLEQAAVWRAVDALFNAV